MVCRTETKDINDREYSVTQWPADKSMLMKFKLAKIFGTSIVKLVDAISESENPKNQTNEIKAIGESLSLLFKDNEPEEIVNFIKSCIIGVACEGKRITETRYPELYSGDNLMEIYKVFLFVVQVNYSNLFKGQKVENFI